MNLENIDLRNIETKTPPQEPATFSGEGEGMTEPAHTGSKFPVAGKPRGFIRPVFVITGVALCMGLASCVVPYDSDGGGSVSVTRYSPGYRVNSLPGGYRSENISGSTYYYHDGYYYRPGSGGYVVVDAPRTSRYYDDYSRRQQTYQTSRTYQQSPDRRDGREYRESSDRHDGRYERTEVITRLPDVYREVRQRGNTYYQVGDRYYRRDNDRYVIVSSPY